MSQPERPSLQEALDEYRRGVTSMQEAFESPPPAAPSTSREELLSRFASHELDEKQQSICHTIRRSFYDIAERFDDLLPNGREKSLVMTHLETASFYANASVARGGSR